jgi:hypothetical protein
VRFPEGRETWVRMGSPRETARLTIAIDVASEPISGQVDLGGNRQQVFVGWTALAELLEEARMGGTPCRCTALIVSDKERRPGAFIRP